MRRWAAVALVGSVSCGRTVTPPPPCVTQSDTVVWRDSTERVLTEVITTRCVITQVE